MFIDVHCHLTDEVFDGIGTEKIVADAQNAGVGRLICSGYDLPSSIASAKLSEKFPNVYFTAGLQPEELKKYREGDLDGIRALLKHEKCVALGEIGLDYHFPDNPDKEFQKEIFKAQLVIADEEGLPVVIHSRDAAADTLDMLTENKSLLKRGGLLHCYSYSKEMVPLFSALGLYFSFGGTSTFKNAKKVHESVQLVPACRILSETDSPYLTPAPFRGQFPNRPELIPYIVQNFAVLRNLKEETLEQEIYDNAKRLFFKLG